MSIHYVHQIAPTCWLGLHDKACDEHVDLCSIFLYFKAIILAYYFCAAQICVCPFILLNIFQIKIKAAYFLEYCQNLKRERS